MTRAFKVEMLTAMLEEEGWNSVRGRATMLRWLSRTFFGQESWQLKNPLRKSVLSIRTPFEWARMWVIFNQNDHRNPALHKTGLQQYLTG